MGTPTNEFHPLIRESKKGINILAKINVLFSRKWLKNTVLYTKRNFFLSRRPKIDRNESQLLWASLCRKTASEKLEFNLLLNLRAVMHLKTY